MHVPNFVTWGITTLAHILYPEYCRYCHEFLTNQEKVLCTSCLGLVQKVVTYPLKISQTQEITVFAAGAYKDPLRHLVTAKHIRLRTAAYDLAYLLWHFSDLKHAQFDYIVPVPLHWSRYASRWYNQAEEMAHALSIYSGKPVVTLLERAKKTSFQAGLSRDERHENVKNIFQIGDQYKQDADRYKHATVVVIDDVMTTGATLTAAVKALKSVQPVRVLIGVGCRVI